MKIAIFYICTGKYEAFWDAFYRDCEMYFYPDIAKDYFVFTDSKRIIEDKIDNVHPYYQAKSGWPYDTMLRFQWFCTVEDKLQDFDFCYYFNANSKFLNVIDETNLSLPTVQLPLIFWCHARHEDDYNGSSFHPERNPLSTAYVSQNSICRCYGGGFYGGKIVPFMEMCRTLRDNIMIDLSNGIVAIWHDQSHIINYAITHPHLEVPKQLISEEEYIKDINICVLMFVSKEHFGGTDSLRGYPISKRIKNRIMKYLAGFKRRILNQIL